MFTHEEVNLISKAKELLESKLNSNPTHSNPVVVKTFCQTALATSEQEIFGVLFLNNKNQLIRFKQMFYGTVNACSVHVREVAKLALKYNASKVILTHNHPSDTLEESHADRNITKTIKTALNLFDIDVLDHIIVTKSGTFSFAERGLL